ncbi:MAG: TlpA family protein disulfide reductase [Moheibacter sp.]
MKIIFLSVLILLFTFQSCKNEEKVEIGEVTERSAEEIAAIKTYAPQFSFVSIEGEQVALESLKGKYLYVDIWATWCRPCLQQLPAMKELEAKYDNQNIEFVSISVDKESDKNKWQNMVNEKQMKGIQLFAGRTSSFHQDYEISTIPKFLIIGKEGEIINNDPPRPMDYKTGQVNQELVSILDNLLTEDKS